MKTEIPIEEIRTKLESRENGIDHECTTDITATDLNQDNFNIYNYLHYDPDADVLRIGDIIVANMHEIGCIKKITTEPIQANDPNTTYRIMIDMIESRPSEEETIASVGFVNDFIRECDDNGHVPVAIIMSKKGVGMPDPKHSQKAGAGEAIREITELGGWTVAIHPNKALQFVTSMVGQMSSGRLKAKNSLHEAKEFFDEYVITTRKR